MFWLSMDNDIITSVRTCRAFTEYLPLHPPQPLLSHARASEFMHSYLGCHNGRDFLLLADDNSGWTQVVPFPDKNISPSNSSTMSGRSSLSAEMPWSDGGPKFTSDEFNTFLRKWGIIHGVSSQASFSQTASPRCL